MDNFIITILSSAGLSGILTVFLLWLTKTWISDRLKISIKNEYDEKLETHKANLRAESGVELEKLKSNLQKEFNRVSKVHEKEFEILPEVWMKLNETKDYVQYLVAPMRSYPDFNQMKEEEIREFSKDSFLKDYQVTELLNSSDKNKYYMEKVFWYDLYNTKQKFREFNTYFTNNRIFLGESIKTKFEEVDALLWSVLVEKETNEEMKIYPDFKRERKAVKEMRSKLKTLVANIESEVQKRLSYDKA